MTQHDPDALARWRTDLATLHSFGLTITTFCRTHTITVSNFYCWRNILVRLDAHSKSSQQANTPYAVVHARLTAAI